jgi:hypothetical protein
MGRAIELRHRHDVGAHVGEVEDRIVESGLAGTRAQRFDTAFELGDAPLQHRRGRIADAAIAVSLYLEIEESRSVLSAVERVCYGLIDRDGYCPRRGIDFIAAMDGDRFISHRTSPLDKWS